MKKTYDDHEIMKDIIIDDLEDLGDYLDVKEMAQNIKYYNVDDIKELISNNTLPAKRKNGKDKVKLEDYADWYASVIYTLPKNGNEPKSYGETNWYNKL